jgi:hypothetical protein
MKDEGKAKLDYAREAARVARAEWLEWLASQSSAEAETRAAKVKSPCAWAAEAAAWEAYQQALAEKAKEESK